MKKVVLFSILSLFLVIGIAGILIAEENQIIKVQASEINSNSTINVDTSNISQSDNNETEVDDENETEVDDETEIEANLICCHLTITGEDGLTRDKYRFMRKENCASQDRYLRLSLEKVNKSYCKEEIDDRFEHMKEVREEKNRLRAHVADYLNKSECPEDCTCTGSTIKCELNGERQMTVVAGKSGNIIIQIKGINASTNVTLYKANGKVYGVFKGNQTMAVLGPDQIKEKIRHRLKVKLENENITLDEDGFYHMQSKKKARLFLIIPVKEKMRAQIEAETGEIVQVRNPWWGFLAKDVKEKSEEKDCGDSINSTLADSCCQAQGYDSWDLSSEECIISE